MARKRNKHGAHENHERWMVSYADFITLMFALFVVMFASSQTDKTKAKQISESVQNALDKGHMAAVVAAILGGTADEKGLGNAQREGPGGAQKAGQEHREPKPPGENLAPSLEFLLRELQKEIRSGQMQVGMQPRGLVVSLKQAAFFPSGEDTIAPEMYPAIEKVTATISRLPNPVRLEGHTDSVPIHNSRFRNNWDLSAARSIAMLALLTTRFGINRDRLAVAGYAETIPVATNDTEEGRAMNRRVDIVVLSQQASVTEPKSEAQ